MPEGKSYSGGKLDSPAYKGDKGNVGDMPRGDKGGKVQSPANTAASTTGEAKGHKV